MIFSFESPNPYKSSFGEFLEAFLDSPEVFWVVLAPFGRIWCMPWVRPGVPECVLVPFWDVLVQF